MFWVLKITISLRLLLSTNNICFGWKIRIFFNFAFLSELFLGGLVIELVPCLWPFYHLLVILAHSLDPEQAPQNNLCYFEKNNFDEISRWQNLAKLPSMQYILTDGSFIQIDSIDDTNSYLTLCMLGKDLWHFDRVSAYFSDASQNFPMHNISLVSFWIGRLMY